MAFTTMEEARLAANTWLIRNRWLSKIERSDKGRIIYKCYDKHCPFTLNIIKIKKGIRLTKLVYHTCPISTHDKHKSRSRITVIS